MSAQNGEGNIPDRNHNQDLPRDPEHHSEGSSATQVNWKQ
jgi:hypothetical protein